MKRERESTSASFATLNTGLGSKMCEKHKNVCGDEQCNTGVHVHTCGKHSGL